MARHILIVEKSRERRRELQAKILAILDDVIISEAPGEDEALAFFERATVHLVLYGWHGGGMDFIVKMRERGEAALLVLVHGRTAQRDYERLSAQGIAVVALPCSGKNLGAAVDKACNPVCLRKDKRRGIPGATAVVEQGGRRFEAKVLNISEGGALCDFRVDGDFNCLAPAMLALRLPLDGRTLAADGLYAVTTHLKVLERHGDFTPLLIRVGFSFIIVPDRAAAVFRRLDDGD